MKMQLPLGHKTNCTPISGYAPTMTNPEETKDRFYEERDSLISSVLQTEKLIVFGDSNACVGSGHQAWHNINEKHGVGKYNSYGLLLSLCASHNLTITNTMVKDRQGAHLTEAMHGTSADCLKDHPANNFCYCLFSRMSLSKPELAFVDNLVFFNTTVSCL